MKPETIKHRDPFIGTACRLALAVFVWVAMVYLTQYGAAL